VIQLKVLLRVEGSIDGLSRMSCVMYKDFQTYKLTALVVINPMVAGLLAKILDYYAIVIKE
jgi:hypothetical protein